MCFDTREFNSTYDQSINSKTDTRTIDSVNESKSLEWFNETNHSKMVKKPINQPLQESFIMNETLSVNTGEYGEDWNIENLEASDTTLINQTVFSNSAKLFDTFEQKEVNQKLNTISINEQDLTSMRILSVTLFHQIKIKL